MPEEKKHTPQRPEPPRPKPEPVRKDDSSHRPGKDQANDSMPSRVQPTQEWPRPEKKKK